jgi:hypothetical protein
MVGSIFAPPNHEGTEAGSRLEASETVAAKEADRREQRELSNDPLLPTIVRRHRTQEQPVTQEKRFEPLVPVSTQMNTPRSLADAIDPGSSDEKKTETAPVPTFTPLMPVREQRPISLARPPAPPAQQSANPLATPPASPARQPAGHAVPQRAIEREPDEIQIHIGRVEVLAVPQTQTPVIPRTPRKAPSLDDYLRRRDGRSS